MAAGLAPSPSLLGQRPEVRAQRRRHVAEASGLAGAAAPPGGRRRSGGTRGPRARPNGPAGKSGLPPPAEVGRRRARPAEERSGVGETLAAAGGRGGAE